MIEVKEIKQDEYKDGVLSDYFGVPPNKIDIIYKKIINWLVFGKFTDDLELFEYVTELERTNM